MKSLKKKVILMIGFVLSLFVFVGCDGDVSFSQKGEDNQQIQSEILDTTTKEDIQEIDTGEDIREADEGWTLLTDEELAWFNNTFFNNADNQIRHYFLDNEFIDIKDVDLFRLFYDLPHTQEDVLTKSELRAIEQMGVDIGLDVQKVPVEYMNEVLRTYAGITLEETNKVNLDLFVYLAEYDAYYMSKGDCHYKTLDIIWGQKDANGVVRLQYEGYDFSQYEVTLVPYENGYYFASNIKIDNEINTQMNQSETKLKLEDNLIEGMINGNDWKQKLWDEIVALYPNYKDVYMMNKEFNSENTDLTKWFADYNGEDFQIIPSAEHPSVTVKNRREIVYYRTDETDVYGNYGAGNAI